MAWANIDIFDNQVVYQNDNSMLIKIRKSETKFWVTQNCVHKGKTYNSYRVGLNDEWSYTTVRGKTNIKETISGVELIGKFIGQAPIKRKKYKPAEYVKHIPDDKEPLKKRVIDDDLIRRPEESD